MSTIIGKNSLKTKIKVAVLTQEDSFVIPKNISLLSNIKEIDLCLVCRIDSSGSLHKKKMLFIKGFGIMQACKMGLLIIINKILDFFDSIFFYKLNFLRSLKSAANFSKAEYKTIDDPNSIFFMNSLKEKKIDLIVSFSAPSIFNNDLLKIPLYGCINLHCSLLPKYAGLLPSFWSLYKDEKSFGATVHRMDTKIDNGSILGQVTIATPKNPTMFKIIKETKIAGGNLMVSIIKDIIKSKIIDKPNNTNPENYYSWPTVNQIKLFKKNGGRLI